MSDEAEDADHDDDDEDDGEVEGEADLEDEDEDESEDEGEDTDGTENCSRNRGQREVHNASEKRRRGTLSKSFGALKDIIPQMDNVDKVRIIGLSFYL